MRARTCLRIGWTNQVSGSELPASEAGSSCLPSEAYTLPGSEEIEDGRLSSIIHVCDRPSSRLSQPLDEVLQIDMI